MIMSRDIACAKCNAKRGEPCDMRGVDPASGDLEIGSHRVRQVDAYYANRRETK